MTGGLHAIHLRRRAVHDAGARDVRLRHAHRRHGQGAASTCPCVSLTCPNVYWGGARGQPAGGANHERRHGGRARRVSGPHPLVRVRCPGSTASWRSRSSSAPPRRRVGVMVLANIDGEPLTDPAFAPIWQAIDALALPVLVHPTAPPGVAEMQMTNSSSPRRSASRSTPRSRWRAWSTTASSTATRSQDHRLPRRRRAAVPHRAAGPVLRQHPGVPRQDLRAAVRVHAEDHCRRGRVRTRRTRPLRQGFGADKCCMARTIRTPSATCRDASRV